MLEGFGDVINNSGVVRLNSGATMYLTNGVAEIVGALYLNGALQASGTWGSSASIADNKNDTYFSGTGFLIVGGTLADGSWSNNSSGFWSVAGNWTNNVIAAGVGSSAYFTNAVSGDRIVTQDYSRLYIGNMTFGSPGNYAWTITNNEIDLRGMASSLITVNGSTATVFSVIDAPSFTKAGSGTLVLAGSNSFGTLNINTGTVQTVNVTTGVVVNVGNQAGQTGVLDVNNGIFAVNGGGTINIGSAVNGSGILKIRGTGLVSHNSNSAANVGINLGAQNPSLGVVYQTGGTLYFNNQLMIGNSAGAHGFYLLGNGSIIATNTGGAARSIRAGAGGGYGMFYQTNGSVTAALGLDAGYNGGSTGIIYITGGTYRGGNGMNMANTAGGRSEVNIDNAADVSLNGAVSVVSLASCMGVLNLNGGLFQVTSIGQGAGTGIVNFAGGTLRAPASTATFLQGISVANVYAGGAVIDSWTNAITIGQNLLTPTGSGVASIALSGNGAGYLAPPAVRIVGGGGTGATAIAQMDMNESSPTYGKLTGILVTCPGFAYTTAPTVTLMGGGSTNAATIGVVNIATNIGGGLTKIGTGTLTLTGSNSYSGATVISGGIVALAKGGALSQTLGGSIIANTNGILRLDQPNELQPNAVVTANSGTFDLQTNRDYFSGLTLCSNGLVTGTTGWFILNDSVTGTISATNGGNAGTIAANIAIASQYGTYPGNRTQNVDVAAGTLLTISGSIADYREGTAQVGMLTKIGLGTLSLSGTNIYTGNTVISNGTLQLFLNGTIAASTNVSVETNALLVIDSSTGNAIGDAATLVLKAGPSTTGRVFLGGSTIEIVGSMYFDGAPQSGTWGSSLSAAANKDDTRFAGTGILSVGAYGSDGAWSNNVSDSMWSVAGNWTNSAIALGSSRTAYFTNAITANRIVNQDSNAVYVGNLTFGSPGAFSWTLQSNSILLVVTSGVPVITVSANTGTVSSVITGNQGFTKSGAGVLTLISTNTYTGATVINAGTLRIDGGGLLGGGSYGDNITNNVAFIYNSTANQVLGGTISGTGAFTKASTGVLTLSGVNTFNGGMTVNAGKISLGNISGLPITGALTINNSATLDLNGFDGTIASLGAGGASGVISNSAAGAGTNMLTITNFTTTLNNLVVDDGNRKVALAVANANQQPYFANNNSTFSGGLILKNNATGTRLNISAAPVNTGVAGAIISSPFGRGPITIGQTAADKAQLFITAAGETILNDVVFNTALGTDVKGAFRIDTNGLTLAGTLTGILSPVNLSANIAGSAILAGQLTGTNGFWVQYSAGNLTVTLSNVTVASNNYQGVTTVDSPYILALGKSDQIPNGAGVGNVALAGRFFLNGFNETINGLSGTGAVDSVSGNSTLLVGDNNTTSTFSGTFRNSTGTLNIVKIGTGVFTLNSSSLYAGSTIVSNGVLDMGAVGSISGSTSIVVEAGARLVLENILVNGLPDGAAVNLKGAGAMYITNNLAEDVGSLFFNGVPQAAGTWGSSSSIADNKNDTYFAGSGVLVVGLAGADGSWSNNVNGGNWSAAGNWTNSVIAMGSTRTAYFTNAISGDKVVTQDYSAAYIGNVIFGSPGNYNWAIINNPVCLASTTSTITVNANTATVASAVSASKGLTKAGVGTLVLGGTNTISTMVNSAGALTFSGGSNLITSLVNNAGPLTLTGVVNTISSVTNNAGSMLFTGSTNVLGVITLNAGSMTFGSGSTTNAGVANFATGTVTFAAGGTNSFGGGNLIFGNGTQTINGPVSLATNALFFYAGYNAGDRSVTFLNTNLSIGYQSCIGQNNGASAALYQNGGVFTVGNYHFVLNGAASGYGYQSLNNGVFNPAQLEIGTSGNGVMEVFGGTLTNAGSTILARNLGGTGLLNIYGGLSYCSISIGLTDKASCYGVINVLGTGVLNAANGSVNRLLNMDNNNAAGGTGIVNLVRGGMIIADGVGASQPGLTLFNFDGGTLTAAPGTTIGATFMTNGLAAVNIYRNGAFIDSDTNIITIALPLRAPAGNGVASLALVGSGTGYIGTPSVVITGGGGAGACAIAQMDLSAGIVTNILVTSPGYGYTTAPAVSLAGGGYLAPAIVGAVSYGPNVSGGLVKLGGGTLIITNISTYSGSTIVSNGILVVSNAGSIVSSAGVAVETNAQLVLCSTANVIGDSASVMLKTAGGFFSRIYLTNGVAETVGVLSSNGVILASGTWGATGSGAGNTNDNFFAGAGLLTVAGAGDGSWTNDNVDGDWSVSGNWLNGVIATGAWRTAYFTNAIIANRTVNEDYTTLNIGNLYFGSPAAFSWTVTNSIINLTNNSAPVITIVANTATIESVLAGGQGIVKAGAGTLVLSGANTYGGDTVINAGVLKLGVADVLPDGAGKGNVYVNGMLDLAGLNETVNGLGGTGVVDNTTGVGTYTLTLGNNNQGGAFAGIITNTSGTIALVKTGTGVQILSRDNFYSGGSTISGGTLQAGNGSTSGTFGPGNVANNSVLSFYRSDTVDVNIGTVISGTGAVTYLSSGVTNQGRYIVDENNGYTGGTTITNASVRMQNVNAFGTGTVTVRGSGQVFLDTASLNLTNALNISGNGWLESSGTNGAIRMAGNSTISGPVALVGASRITAYAVGDTGTISGVVTGNFAVEKSGLGRIILSNTNNFGVLTVSGGNLTLNGSSTNTFSSTVNVNGGTPGAVLTFNGSTTISNNLQVAYQANDRAVVNISTNVSVYQVLVGYNTATANGALFQSNGVITVTNAADSDDNFIIARNTVGAYGYYNLSGGTLVNGQRFNIGQQGNGVMDMSGGVIMAPLNVTSIGHANQGAGTNYGIANISGGTLYGSTNNGIRLGYDGANSTRLGYGIINLSGSGVLYGGPAGNTARQLEMALNGASGGNVNYSTLNLNGGTAIVNRIFASVPAGTISLVNFNGGLLQANAGTTLGTSFLQSMTAANVYPGGAFIDSGTNIITIGQSLLAPVGSGVAGIGTVGGGAGYIGAPVVAITGGGGTGACAIAQMDFSNGTLANILVTSPGYGYTSAPAVTLLGGGFTSAATVGVVSIGANGTGGGLVKIGTGMLKLTNTCTYGGSTIVSNGVLDLIGAGASIGGSTSITVEVGAQLFLENILTNQLKDNAAVYLKSGSGTRMYLTNGMFEAVGTLYFDGVAQTSGTWGSSISAALYTNDTFFAGYGVLIVGPVADGVWSYDGDGIWSAATNWTNNVVAAGPFNTAYFTNAISGDRIVSQDSNTMYIGSMTFGSPGNYKWTITNNVINLRAGTAPTITVNASTAVVASALNAVYMTKAGNGDLFLINSNIVSNVVVSAGNLYFAGTNRSILSNITVNAGTLTFNAPASCGGVLNVGNVAGDRGVANVNAYLTFTQINHVGNAAGSAGAIYQNGGTYIGGNELQLGVSAGSYGYYQLAGGYMTNGAWVRAAGDNGLGIFYQSSGTNIYTGNGLIAATGAGTGVVYLTGGLWSNSGAAYMGYNNSPGSGRAEVTVAGGATFLINNSMQMNKSGTGNASTNFLNMNGGLFRVNNINKGVAGGWSVVNFNGGTLQSGAAGSLMSAGAVDAAYVWGGGAIIDSSNLTITMSQSLLAPLGSGVTNITIVSGGTGYIGAPYVNISGGGGTGACAIAKIDPAAGIVTNILVVNPGVNYAVAPTVTLIGGGCTSTATVGVASLGANYSGGFVKLGSGTLSLTNSNTYTGLTVVAAGYLNVLTNANVLAGTAGIIVSNNAGLKLYGGLTISKPLTVNGDAGDFLGNLTSLNLTNTWNGPITLGNTARIGAQTNSSLVINGAIDSGTNIFDLSVRGSNETGAIVLNSSGNTYSGATVVVAGTLRLGVTNALPVSTVVRMGNTSNISTARLDMAGCDLLVAGLTNLGTTMQMMITNSSATMSTLTVSNSLSTGYGGLITTNITLVKAGSGVLALGSTNNMVYTNTYIGATVVSNGTLQIGTNAIIAFSSNIVVNAGAQLMILNTNNVISDSAPVYLGAGATVYLTNGVRETVASLYIDGIPAPTGSWGAVNCQWTNTSLFAGSGVLVVTNSAGSILAVSTAFGVATPSGTTTNFNGTIINASATTPVADGAFTQYVCFGWAGTGSATNGVGSSTSFTMSNNSTLVWLWATNYMLTTGGTNGNVDVVTGWQLAGAAPTLTATASNFFHFTNWAGTTNSCPIAGNQIQATMDRARWITALFDANMTTNPNPTPEWWLNKHFGVVDYNATDLLDSDGDGLLNWQEYITGTDPTNADSKLSISSATPIGTFYDYEYFDTDLGFIVTQQLLNVENIVVQWPTSTGRFYRLFASTNLINSWPTSPVYQVMGDGVLMVYTNEFVTNKSPRFFRVEASIP